MIEAYTKARKLAEKAFNGAVRQHRNPYLEVLDEKTHGGMETEKLGIMEIPASLFVGTVTAGRQNAFAVNFMPLLSVDSEFAWKWSRLYEAQINEGIRDAVKAYEYEGLFYVQEGNKRVSVLKYLDVQTIMCDVTRIMPDQPDKLYQEFLEFYRCTSTYSFRFSRSGSYRQLAKYMNLTLTEKWPREEINQLEACFYRFRVSLEARGNHALKDYAADAFMVYLSIYPMDSLLDLTRPVIDNRIEVLASEMAAIIEPARIETEGMGVRGKSHLENLFSAITGPKYSENRPLKVSFIYSNDDSYSAWSQSHEQGRRYVDWRFGSLVTTAKYPVETGQSVAAAIDRAYEEGTDVIFTVSAEDMEETLKSAIRYPDIRFFNCSLNQSHAAVPTYYIRNYEVKFLLGVLAGIMAKDHKIGYLSDYPIYGNIAAINAFAIGASFIDPEVRVHLKWSTIENNMWRDEMIAEGINIVSGHDLTKKQWGTNEQGLFESQWDGNYRKLAMPVINWGRYYELIIDSVINGDKTDSDKAVNYWLGLETGVIDLELCEDIPYQTVKLLEALKKDLISGDLNPFSGELHSQKGMVQPDYSTRLSNEQIITMNWLNDNVIGYLPHASELVENARKIVDVSGVQEEDA